MKTRLWRVLAILTLTRGCAQGYSDQRPAYREPGATMRWYQNPETESEYQMRLWSEEAGSYLSSCRLSACRGQPVEGAPDCGSS